MVLRVMPARVIDARGLGEQTAGAGLGAKREDVGPGNSERSTVSISVDVGQVKESMLVLIDTLPPLQRYALKPRCRNYPAEL
jgi:hypothetical protein